MGLCLNEYDSNTFFILRIFRRWTSH